MVCAARLDMTRVVLKAGSNMLLTSVVQHVAVHLNSILTRPQCDVYPFSHTLNQALVIILLCAAEPVVVRVMSVTLSFILLLLFVL